VHALLISDRRVMGAFSKLRAGYRKCAWLAGRDWPSTGGVLNITAVAWTTGFQWWRSGDITRTQNAWFYFAVACYLLCGCTFKINENVHFLVYFC